MTKTTEVKTITLDEKIEREGQTIEVVEVRKPDSGSLRGVNLVDILQMDVNALIIVLPRITAPMLSKPEIMKMNPADLLQLGSELSSFLLPKSEKPESRAE